MASAERIALSGEAESAPAPMKAPSPPPTIPCRMRGSAMSRTPIDLSQCSGEAQRPPDLRRVARAAGEVVKGPVGDADDVVADKGRAFARAVLRVLQTAFPLQHRPAVEPDCGQPREDRLEVDLPDRKSTRLNSSHVKISY